MGRVNNYLLSQFLSVFAPLFFTLFFITSIVYFIQIARITSVIKITFLELANLYLFLLPKVFIFTLPVTFFIALCITLFKLSRENETTVMFTLGYSPKKIAKFFLVIASLLSTFLVINVLILMPLSKDLQSNFIDFKKAEAKFNIKATEFGQKFSNWLVFINDSKDNSYKKIIMYSNEEQSSRLVSATEAIINNEKGGVSLELKNGKSYDIKQNEMHQIDFSTMLIRTYISDKVREINNIKTYWLDILTNRKKGEDFSFYLLLSLFPLASCLFALSFGIVTFRYERTSIYFYTTIVVISYFSITFFVGKIHPILSLVSVFSAFFLLSFFTFKYKILNRY